MNAHALREVVEFTSRTIGWTAMPSGGQVPIVAAYPEPIWRWYCECGSVGGTRPSRESAILSHARHADAWSKG